MNYGGKEYGDLSLRQALAYSDNVIAVKVLEAIGVPYFTEFAGKMGLPLRAQNGLSLALGTDEVTLNELVQAYTPLVTGGMRSEARTIIRVYDRRRHSWMENPTAVTPVLAPAAAFVTTQMMRDGMTYGTAKSLRKFSRERPSAGKTGTTDDYRDAWFIGYTPQVITGIWVGYDKPRAGGKSFTGGAAAAPIWERCMRRAVAAKPVADFPMPVGVVSVAIDPATGFPATAESPHKRDEFFITGTEPGESPPTPGGAEAKPEPVAPSLSPSPPPSPSPPSATEDGK